jgi:hypothetical protein
MALLTIPPTLVLAVAFIGIGNATTEATGAQLLAQAAVFVLFIGICLVVALKADRLWLGWLATFLAWLPHLLFWLALTFG